jgi:hypothetical protein
MLEVVLVYAVLFMEWDDKGSPFDEVGALFLMIRFIWIVRKGHILTSCFF